MKQNHVDLLKDNIFHIFLKFAFTSVAGMLMMSIFILFDTIFIGRGVGSQGLAALNIAIPVFSLLTSTGMLIGIGGATALSVNLGQGNTEKAKVIFTHSIGLAIIMGIIYTITGLTFLDKISIWLGATNENIDLVKDYLTFIFSFSLSFIIMHTLTIFIRNDKAPKLAMWGVILGGLINIFLDALFIFQFNWGMKGAAIATAISSVISVLIFLTHFIKGSQVLVFKKAQLELAILKRIFLNGVPSFIMEFSSGVIIFAFNRVILNMLGEIGVSSYSIIANISLICVALFTGVAQAIQPIASINYGAGNIDRVKKVRNFAFGSALLIGGLAFLVGNLFPQKIVRLFTSANEELVQITVNGMRYYFIAFLIMGLNIVLAAYYQSMENPTLSTVISVSRGIAFVLLGLAFLPLLFDINGVWLSVPFAEVSTLILGFMISKNKRYKIADSGIMA